MVGANPSRMDPFDSITLAQLQSRKSEKWSKFPADVLPAFVAEMDFALAPVVRDAVVAMVERGDTGYAYSAGVPDAFAAFVRARFGWSVDAVSVFAVPDVAAGIAEALALLTDEDAGIVINPPVYPPFFEIIPHGSRRVVEVPLRRDPHAGWALDLDRLQQAFADGARAYLLCNPHNPVGRAWSASELRDVASLAHRYGVTVISDEIHAPLVMPGTAFVPYLTLGSGTDAIALHSASKAFNIPGLKCAVMVASDSARDRLRARLASRADEVETRIGHPGTIATIAAFRDGGPWLDGLVAYLDGNRNLLAALLEEKLPGVRYSPPEATYLAWLDCSALQLSEDPASVFLERGRVALEPGRKFSRDHGSWVRLNFGTSREILGEIVSRMAAALRM